MMLAALKGRPESSPGQPGCASDYPAYSPGRIVNGDRGSRRRWRKLPLSKARSGGAGPRTGVVAPLTPKLIWMSRFVVLARRTAGNDTGVSTR